MNLILRWMTFIFGMMIFSTGITLTINVRHLGLAPWDVLGIGMYQHFGLTIGSWNIIISLLLIGIAFLMDRRYLKIGTFVNAVLIGLFVDFYLWLGFLPGPTDSIWLDSMIMIVGIVVMGFGGGLYNAPEVGAGPRDGFMMSLSDKTGMSIRRVRITVESFVLLIGFLIGGPVFIFSIIFTFIQSPIFQASFHFFKKRIAAFELKLHERKVEKINQEVGE